MPSRRQRRRIRIIKLENEPVMERPPPPAAGSIRRRGRSELSPFAPRTDFFRGAKDDFAGNLTAQFLTISSWPTRNSAVKSSAPTKIDARIGEAAVENVAGRRALIVRAGPAALEFRLSVAAPTAQARMPSGMSRERPQLSLRPDPSSPAGLPWWSWHCS